MKPHYLIVATAYFLVACGGDTDKSSEQSDAKVDSSVAQNNTPESIGIFEVFDRHGYVAESILISEGLAKIDLDRAVARFTNFPALTEFEKNRHREAYYNFVQRKLDKVIQDILSGDLGTSYRVELSEFDFERNTYALKLPLPTILTWQPESETWEAGSGSIDWPQNPSSFATLPSKTRVEFVFDRNPANTLIEFDSAELGEKFLNSVGRTPKLFSFWNLTEVTTVKEQFQISFEHQCHIFAESDGRGDTNYYIPSAPTIENTEPCERFASTGRSSLPETGYSAVMDRIVAFPDEMKEQGIWIEK